MFGLTREMTAIYSRIVRKSQKVPELQQAVVEGKLSVTKAHRLTSVITKENKKNWIEFAQIAPKAKLEKEIAKANPAIVDRMEFVHPTREIKDKVVYKEVNPGEAARVQMHAGMSEELSVKIRRVQDLESKAGRSASLEKALLAAVETYLEKFDPIRKAKRAKARGKLKETPKPRSSQKTMDQKSALKSNGQNSQPSKTKGETTNAPAMKSVPGHTFRRGRVKRTNIPAKTIHQLQLKLKNQCAHQDKQGKRCKQRRYLDIHHIQPVSKGGTHDLNNLTLLCNGHHRAIHARARE